MTRVSQLTTATVKKCVSSLQKTCRITKKKYDMLNDNLCIPNFWHSSLISSSISSYSPSSINSSVVMTQMKPKYDSFNKIQHLMDFSDRFSERGKHRSRKYLSQAQNFGWNFRSHKGLNSSTRRIHHSSSQSHFLKSKTPISQPPKYKLLQERIVKRYKLKEVAKKT